MTLVAGVDSSTQSCKVVVRDAHTGASVRTGRAEHPPGTEVDPEAWWSALCAAVDDAGGLGDVAALGVAAQQHGMIVLDADGAVLRDALLWNDTRSADAADDLASQFGAEALAARTGSVPVASFTVTKLRWLRDHEPAVAERVAAAALPHDWLAWRLRGYGPRGRSPLGPDLSALTTDRSDASGTGYWHPSAGEWDHDLLTAALGRDVVVPRVAGPAERVGVTVAQARTSIPDGVAVSAGAGDNAAAALGLSARAGDAVVSVGTSGTAFAVTPNPSHDATGTVAGFADAAGAFLPLVATLNAARVLSSVAGLLGVELDEFARLALAAPPGADGVVLVPYFEGERTPNLPRARAALNGLTLAATSRENVARAAVEGMLCGLGVGIDALRRCDVVVDRVLLIGGAAQNEAVQRCAAQVFDRPVVVPRPGEYVADGAAAQASWALTGIRPDWPLTIAAEPEPDTRPEIRAQYDREAAWSATRYA